MIWIRKLIGRIKYGKCSCYKCIEDSSEDHRYLRAISYWIKQEENDQMKLLLGSCRLNQVSDCIDREEPMFLLHYVKCVCGRIYKAGWYCRGGPFVREVPCVPKSSMQLTKNDLQIVNIE